MVEYKHCYHLFEIHTLIYGFIPIQIAVPFKEEIRAICGIGLSYNE